MSSGGSRVRRRWEAGFCLPKSPRLLRLGESCASWFLEGLFSVGSEGCLVAWGELSLELTQGFVSEPSG